MTGKRQTAAIGGLLALSLVAAACGKDKSGDSATATTVASTTATTAASTAATTAGASSSSSAATTTATTAAAGPKIGKVDDKTYQGVGGFKLDLTKCPSDYDPMQGITADKITVGISLPKSGPLQGFGIIADGMQSYFTYINEQGGVGGKKIELQVKDDAYEAAKTKTNIDDFIAQGGLAAFVGVLGTPNNLAIWDKTNELCFPHLFNATGAAQWGDTENHPWTTGLQLDYFTAAKLWAEYLKGRFPDGVKVATLTYNNDFGKSYQKGFKAAIKGSKTEIVAEELHEQTAPNVKDQITTLAASNAQVLLVQSSGAFCTDAMRQVAQSDWKPLIIISETCASISQFFKPLDPPDPATPHPGEGVLLLNTAKDVNDSAFQSDPAVKLFKDTATKQGLDPKQTTYATGWSYAEYFVETLKKAATLEGGITRPNLMIAARDLDFTPMFSLPGLKSVTKGNEDAYFVEGGIMKKFTWNSGAPTYVDADGAKLINLEGQTGNYTKVQAAG